MQFSDPRICFNERGITRLEQRLLENDVLNNFQQNSVGKAFRGRPSCVWCIGPSVLSLRVLAAFLAISTCVKY